MAHYGVPETSSKVCDKDHGQYSDEDVDSSSLVPFDLAPHNPERKS